MKDSLDRAFNRATRFEEREQMMQVWADYLDDLKAEAKVISAPIGFTYNHAAVLIKFQYRILIESVHNIKNQQGLKAVRCISLFGLS